MAQFVSYKYSSQYMRCSHRIDQRHTIPIDTHSHTLMLQISHAHRAPAPARCQWMTLAETPCRLACAEVTRKVRTPRRCACLGERTCHAAHAAHLSRTRRSLRGRSQCRARGHAMRVRCGRRRRIHPGRDLARGSPRATRRIHWSRSALSSLCGRCCWHARACRRCRSAIGSAGVARCAEAAAAA